jgi:hypothetical protein
MKGMCGNLRFRPLVEVSERLRAGAKAGDARAVERELAALREALARVTQAVRERWVPEA